MGVLNIVAFVTILKNVHKESSVNDNFFSILKVRLSFTSTVDIQYLGND